MDLLIIASLFIMLVSLVMILYFFRSLDSVEKKSDLGVMMKYYLIRRRYDRMRTSLLFVAALMAVQFIGLLVMVFVPGAEFKTTEILISDFIFVALIVFLTGLYRNKEKLDYNM
ncbi:hypothetical protein GOV10_03075 [Candidatus Woesearchaeota archaeon]|nr:hypothetical protein [Candidatus Woesearchaeota archaeon]